MTLYEDSNIILNDPQLDLKNKILFDILGNDYVKHDNANNSIPPANGTLSNFFVKVKELIDLTQENADQRVLLVETMPEENFFQDPDFPEKTLSGYILTTVLRREPGTLAGGNQPFSGTRQDARPKIVRKIIKKDPDNPGQTTYIISKWFDNLVGLNVCAQTNKRANELVEWLEDLMEKNRWFLEINGFNKLIYKGRMADIRRDDALGKFSFRPLKYYLRTETYYTITEQQLNRLIVQVTT